MAKIIVEIDMGKSITAENLTAMIRENREPFFPVGGNFMSVKKSRLKENPVDEDAYLFKLMGVIE